MEKSKVKGLTDMTVGSPMKHILMFSIPLLVGNIFQQFYNLVDSVVVGQFVGHTALAAVGTAFPVVFLLVSLFMGFGTGGTIMISQFYGAGDNDKVKTVVDTMYSALVIAAIPLTVLGMLICDPILRILDVPPDAMDQARMYLYIILGGVTASLGYNANAGILQGLGDSKTPLLFLVIACIINVVLDLFFVVVLNMGVAGVAVATIIAQTFSWIFGIFYINKKYPLLHIKLFNIKLDKQIFSKILKLGLPVGLQQALFSIGVMALLRLINSYGSTFVAGYNGSNKIDMLAFMPVQSFSIAATTFTGQNIGAGRYDRVKQGTKATVILGVVFSFLAALIILPTGGFLMRMFSPEQAVINAGMAYLWRIMPFYWILAITFALNSVMRGAGEAMVPLISSILSLWLARVPAAYILANYFGSENMHFCFVIGWIVGAIITIPYYFTYKWKNKRVV